jgi:hypothetical protein
MMTPNLESDFPQFAALLPGAVVEEVLPGLDLEGITELESRLGIPLPASYKQFLQRCNGLWLFGGAVQFGSQHPFFHDFPPLDSLSPQQLKVVKQRGGKWPPPSQGMLCFAEYFLEADGDQVLFKVDDGLVNGEYPVYYYAHEDSPTRVTRIADSFGDWIENQCIQAMSDG